MTFSMLVVLNGAGDLNFYLACMHAGQEKIWNGLMSHQILATCYST